MFESRRYSWNRCVELRRADNNAYSVHSYQDTAKSTFDARRRVTQVDLNRAGSGLMEIVSEPDMR
jgi:Asp-tRNA(Asn)/Glu-tRNA(Gln) amidotransferase B subunit